MQQLLLTLNTPAENMALDEALLDAAERGEITGSLLRLWEPADYAVVLGRSSKAGTEVNLEACHRQSVPVLRRPSGGGTVLTGPGCLMYALILSMDRLQQLRAIDLAHQFVLQKMARLLVPVVPSVQRVGISDLAFSATADGPLLKCSGNAMRSKRSHILYHGTFLYDFDVPRIGQLLATPTRQPEYRGCRGHKEFVANLPLTREELQLTLIAGWQAEGVMSHWPERQVAELVQTKYKEGSEWLVFVPPATP